MNGHFSDVECKSMLLVIFHICFTGVAVETINMTNVDIMLSAGSQMERSICQNDTD